MKRRSTRLFLGMLLLSLPVASMASKARVPASLATAYDACFKMAGAQYRISPLLLRAIARHESGMNPKAINVNPGGSEDVGLMQVNLRFNPALRKHGFTREHLFEPCTNIMVGAYILAGFVKRYGMTWYAVGKYNARDEAKGRRYAGLILKQVMVEMRAVQASLPRGSH